MGTTIRRVRRVLQASAVILLVCAGVAQAASLVYVQGGNVFIANVDGSSPHQVTTDGSASSASPTGSHPDDSAYRSPTEADNGTIIAAKGGQLIRMTENGTVLSRYQPANGAYPLAAAISPDGTKVAFNYSEITQCVTYDYASCGYYPAAGAAVENADGSGGYMDTGGSDQDAEWIDNASLVLEATSSRVRYEALGAGSQDWFTPSSPYANPYADQPVVSRSGSYFAVVSRPTSSGGNPSSQDVLEIWRMNGTAPAQAGGPPPAPTLLCGFQTADAAGFQRPSFAPDDSSVIWTDSAGTESLPIDATFASQCENGNLLTLTTGTPLVAGATDASFGEAANAPAPRSTPGPGPTPPGPATSLKASLRTHPATITRAAILRHGLSVTLVCSSACSYGVAIGATNTVARQLGLTRRRGVSVVLGVKGGSERSAGKRNITLSLSPAARHALSRARRGSRIHLILELQFRGPTGAARVRNYGLTIRA